MARIAELKQELVQWEMKLPELKTCYQTETDKYTEVSKMRKSKKKDLLMAEMDAKLKPISQAMRHANEKIYEIKNKIEYESYLSQEIRIEHKGSDVRILDAHNKTMYIMDTYMVALLFRNKDMMLSILEKL